MIICMKGGGVIKIIIYSNKIIKKQKFNREGISYRIIIYLKWNSHYIKIKQLN